jgi:hypothetical protein
MIRKVKNNHKNKEKNNNPEIYFKLLQSDILQLKTDVSEIKGKLKVYDKILVFILSIISAIFIKVVFLS